MGRHKERVQIHHEPTTTERFLCIASMPKWSKLLLEHEPNKPYCDILSGLIEKGFYSESDEKRTIKKMAADLKTDSGKLTKWIGAIYQDIFELNEQKSELFYADGIKTILYMKYFDDSASLSLTLPVIPREYEMFRFYFAKAKTGAEYYWVHRVEHSIEADTYEVCIWLNGGFANKYRDFLYDKAKFYNRIGFFDLHQKTESQIDDELMKIYKG